MKATKHYRNLNKNRGATRRRDSTLILRVRWRKENIIILKLSGQVKTRRGLRDLIPDTHMYTTLSRKNIRSLNIQRSCTILKQSYYVNGEIFKFFTKTNISN